MLLRWGNSRLLPEKRYVMPPTGDGLYQVLVILGRFHFDSTSSEKDFKIVPLTWNIETENEERIEKEVLMTERWGHLFLSLLSPLLLTMLLFFKKMRLEEKRELDW